MLLNSFDKYLKWFWFGYLVIYGLGLISYSLLSYSTYDMRINEWLVPNLNKENTHTQTILSHRLGQSENLFVFSLVWVNIDRILINYPMHWDPIHLLKCLETKLACFTCLNGDLRVWDFVNKKVVWRITLCQHSYLIYLFTALQMGTWYYTQWVCLAQGSMPFMHGFYPCCTSNPCCNINGLWCKNEQTDLMN